RLDQRADRPLEPREVTVERRADEGGQREVRRVLEHPDRVESTGGLSAGLDVGGIVLLLRAVRPRRRPWPVVGVVEPAARGVEQVWCLVYRLETAPLGRRIAAVHRLGPVEAG